MELPGQIRKLFQAPVRPHPATAELSVREGRCSAAKDFAWLDANVPCRKACPAETDVPAYLAAIAEGRFDDAYRINLVDNVFPAVLGRVCSRPCESACRHGYEGLGDPVAICFSKRSAADHRNGAPVVLEPSCPPSGKRIAIVGSGVAGLAAARNLALCGHTVTVLEKHYKPGGMLNQGIPEFRLPREVVAREIRQVAALGVDIVCNTAVGDDLPLSRLVNDYDAVVLAAGTLRPNLLNIPGHQLPGIRHGLDFLLEVNETGGALVGQRVIVIGGGFTAMDCARTAKRLGAQVAELSEDWTLKVLYRRSQAEMRVAPGELEELGSEGIPLECHATPEEYLAWNGRLAGMRFRHGLTGELFDVEADTVLLATGQFPDTSWTEHPSGFGNFADDRKIFVAGDFAQGASSLIEAIAHAKGVAEQVDEFLMGERRLRRSVLVEAADTTGRARAMDAIVRQRMPSMPLQDRGLHREVERGFDPAAAIEEAKRCYRCDFKFEIDQDKCIRCDWCLRARPRPECILMLKELRHDAEGRVAGWEATDQVREMNLIWINSDECIRCGACLAACPVDAISLQKVSTCIEPGMRETPAQRKDTP